MLATFAQLTDTHVRDEESPARVPFLDRLGGAFSSTFRPQEALSTQVLAAAVRAVNRLDPDAVVVTGDIVDSAQAAELDQALAVLDGGEVDPDTGAPGYEGVQAADDPDPLFYRPDLDAPPHPGLLAAAARRFRSPGLGAPWYPALGNHDLLVQGETPPTERIDAFATGTRMIVGLDPELIPEEGEIDSARAVDELLAAGAPGRSLEVTADPRRRHLRPDEMIARLTGREQAPAALRAAAARTTLDYAFDAGTVRALVLDTVDRRGGSRGVLSSAQLDWLRAELSAAAGRPLLVFSHNPLESTEGGDERAGRARRHTGRRRRDRRQLAPQPHQPAHDGERRLLADQHVLARRPPAAGARAARPPHRRGLRARDLDARPRRPRPRGRRARARVPRCPGRSPAGLRRRPHGPQRAAVRSRALRPAERLGRRAGRGHVAALRRLGVTAALLAGDQRRGQDRADDGKPGADGERELEALRQRARQR